MADRKRIDELERRGEQLELERKRLRAQGDLAKLAEQRTMAAISTTALGGLRSYTAGLVTIFVVAVPAFYLITFRGDQAQLPPAEYAVRIAAPFIIALAAILAMRQIALWAGRASYPAARAWFDRLPFPIIGADKLLGEGPDKTFENRLLVTAGSVDRIATAVNGLGNRRISARAGGDAVIVVIDVASRGDNYPVAPATNHRGLQLVRVLVDQVLREVHAEHPIVSLELKSNS